MVPEGRGTPEGPWNLLRQVHVLIAFKYVGNIFLEALLEFIYPMLCFPLEIPRAFPPEWKTGLKHKFLNKNIVTYHQQDARVERRQ